MKRILAAAALGAGVALVAAAPAYATDAPPLSASAKVDCGTVTVTFVNTAANLYSADIRVDDEAGTDDQFTQLGNIAAGPNAGKPYGQRYQTVTVPAGQTVAKTIEVKEDSGKHTVAFRIWRGPETDNYVDWKSVDVESDCKANPSPSATTAQPAAPKDCEAYLYTGTKQNICDRFADATEAKCADVKYRVTLVDNDVDPFGLDGSGGGSRGTIGVGCESNPLKPKPTASESPAAVAAGSGGGLPVTGASITTAAGVGAGVLAVGTGLFFFFRRRRLRFTA